MDGVGVKYFEDGRRNEMQRYKNEEMVPDEQQREKREIKELVF